MASSAPRVRGILPWRSPYLEGGGEHRVGAVPVRPELHIRSGTEAVYRVEQRPGVQRGDRVAAQCVGDDADGLGEMWRTGRVEHHAARPGQPDRRGEQLAL